MNPKPLQPALNQGAAPLGGRSKGGQSKPAETGAPQVVILAAGQGKRMHSDTPKVLHELGGRTLLAHVLSTARQLGCPDPVVVIGHGGDAVWARHAADGARFVVQQPQLGTGDAVRQALPHLHDAAPVLVLYGDVPLLHAPLLAELTQVAQAGALALLTARVAQPDGYGRIVRDAAGAVCAIVEHKDASEHERALDEINTGILCAPMPALRGWLQALDNNNAQREYYLTDVVRHARAAGTVVKAIVTPSVQSALGVNDRVQLEALERIWQRQQAEALMRAGVRVLDAARLDIRGSLRCGRDVQLDVGCVFEGEVVLGDRVRIGPYCVLKDCVLADDVQVASHSVIEGAQVGTGARIGPFARLRPGTQLARDVHVGNFTEVKNSSMGAGSKANHLAYVGDADVGERVNVGAGTITCNYDGANKHRTVIEDDVFIGSNTQLVAPVRVGRGATLGAGTTLTRDAPPEQLTLSRAPQKSVAGWKRPVKQKR